MKNVEVFEKIFWEVGAKYNLVDWYEIYDSQVYLEVMEEICKYFQVASVEEVEGFEDWDYEMGQEL